MKSVKSWSIRQPQWTFSSILWSPKIWSSESEHKNLLMRSETMTFVCLCSVSIVDFIWSLSRCSTPFIFCFAHPSQSLLWLKVLLLFTPFVSVWCLVWPMVTSMWFNTCIALLLHYRSSAISLSCTKDLNISIQGTCTHTHGVDWCLLGDKCVAGMVIRKKINMHTRWTSCLSPFHCLSICSTIDPLIIKPACWTGQYRGLNAQSGPAACRMPDQWCRVTHAGVSACFCCFVGSVCPLANKLMLQLPAQLHPAQTPPVFAVSLSPYGPSYTLKIGFHTPP